MNLQIILNLNIKKLKFILLLELIYIYNISNNNMVKNTKGGNKGKKMGRKFLNAPVSKTIRLANPVEECEIYGVVTKIFGFGRFQIKDEKSKERLVIIPNKFRGRGKRDNTVVLGGLVLVGIREYESSDNPKCDLLEVYNETEKTKLKNSSNPIFNQFKSEFETYSTEQAHITDNFEFSDGTTEKYEEMLHDTQTKETTSKLVSFSAEDDEEQNDVDIDDI
jgi:initiation factor 1A